jgi:hypothetical protein
MTRILLSIPNTLSTRNLLRSTVLAELKAHGAQVLIATPFADEPGFIGEFAEERVGIAPLARYEPGLAERLIFSALYNLYLSGDVPHTLDILLNRWVDNHRVMGPLRRHLTKRWLRRSRGLLQPVVKRAFMQMPDPHGYGTLLREFRPDVAVFTRLFFCDEIPLMRAAVSAGIPTVGVVASWDNLTNKGPLVPRLDRLVVWNDLMREEAIEFHGYHHCTRCAAIHRTDPRLHP